MRIAVNARCLIPGDTNQLSRFTEGFILALATYYPQHQVYLLFQRSGFKKNFKAKNLTALVLKPAGKHPLFMHWWFQISLPKALRKIKADVFISTDGFTTFKTQISRATIIPGMVITDRQKDKRSFSDYYYQNHYKKAIRESEMLLASSEEISQNINLLTGRPFPDITKMLPAANAIFKALDFAQQVRVREKFVSNEAYFLLPEIPTELKNLQQILEAFVLFKTRTYNDLKLVVPGGKNHKNLKQALLAINEKFPATVVITGPIPAESLAPLYGAAVAAIYFAETNSFNLPVLEAQQCACPIIVLSAEKEPYSWVAGSTRRVVPGKVEELFEALVQVYHDVETRKELIHLGYQNAGNFTWEKSLEPVMTQMQKMVNALNNAGALL